MLLALNQLQHLPESALLLGLSAAVSTIGFALFYRQEVGCDKPIIDFSYFRNGDFTVINVMHTLINLAAFSIMLLAPFYLSQVAGLSVPVAGLVLAVSPLGTIIAAPLAGRLTTGRPPRQIALAGTIASAIGLFGISLAGADPDFPILAVSMFVQGFGLGLFQVAYFDIITAGIPMQSRGVAGALGMATRSIGTVIGATVLMLIFQTQRTAGDPPQSEDLISAFQATFRIAAAIPAALAVLELLRRRRPERPSLSG
jgi:MFS family permease